MASLSPIRVMIPRVPEVVLAKNNRPANNQFVGLTRDQIFLRAARFRGFYQRPAQQSSGKIPLATARPSAENYADKILLFRDRPKIELIAPSEILEKSGEYDVRSPADDVNALVITVKRPEPYFVRENEYFEGELPENNIFLALQLLFPAQCSMRPELIPDLHFSPYGTLQFWFKNSAQLTTDTLRVAMKMFGLLNNIYEAELKFQC